MLLEYLNDLFSRMKRSEAQPTETIHEKLEIARRFLSLSQICDNPPRYFILKRYLSELIDPIVLVFWKLYDKTVIDHVPNFCRPKNFHPEVFSENKLKVPKNIGANHQNLLE